MTAGGRDTAVDVAKCLAALLIVNSHLGELYPPSLAPLATGGAIGNALFFYCSGYALGLGRFGAFLPWYKRRLARIMPSFLVCTVVCSYVLGRAWWPVAAHYWFVRCILAHYVAIYAVRARLMGRKALVCLLSAAAIVAWWAFLERPQDDIYASAYFLWLHYFPCTLVGLFAAASRRLGPPPAVSAAAAAAMAAVYYGSRAVAVGSVQLGVLQLVAVPAIAVLPHFAVNAARSGAVSRAMATGAGRAVRFVGGLSLEIYMVHFLVADACRSLPVPLGLALALPASILFAYLLRALVRLMLQTFDGGRADYDFRSVFRME